VKGVLFKVNIEKEELKYTIELRGNNLPLEIRRKY
jgi:hypothetical protein